MITSSPSEIFSALMEEVFSRVFLTLMSKYFDDTFPKVSLAFMQMLYTDSFAGEKLKDVSDVNAVEFQPEEASCL